MINDIYIKTKKSFAIIPALILTGIVVLFYADQGKKIFDWSCFNPNGINSIIFLIILSFSVLMWILYFDNKPEYKISDDGIWYRKIFFIRQLNSLLRWDNIDYYFLNSKSDKGVSSEQLVIKMKDRDKYFKISLNGLDISQLDFLQIMTDKSTKYSFQDLGVDENWTEKNSV